jgi:Family of unknown function (DUF6325)
MTGPVQVLVVGFEQPTFSGEVLAELDRLRQAGTVRLLDVLLVARAEHGAFETLPFPASAPANSGTLVAAILGDSDAGLTSAVEQVDGPAWSLADAIPVGTTAAVALIEHLWAAPLREAIHQAGGTALDETWLAGEDVQRVDQLIAERSA